MNASSAEFITHCSSGSLRDSAKNDAELMAKAEAVGAALV
jgi:hypothetical protein